MYYFTALLSGVAKPSWSFSLRALNSSFRPY